MAWWFTGYDSAADPAVRALADLTAALTAPRNMTPFEEAVARFDRGLPLLEEHIEILFGISRHLRPSGRTTTRGKKWFSPEQVQRWRDSEKPPHGSMSTSPSGRTRRSARSASSTDPATRTEAGGSTSSRRAARESADRSVAALVAKLRPRPSPL
jgi:hypothetical protein